MRRLIAYDWPGNVRGWKMPSSAPWRSAADPSCPSVICRRTFSTQEFLERHQLPHVAKPFRVEELTEKVNKCW